MKFKACIFFGLLLALLLISSTAVAEKTEVEKNSNAVEETTEANEGKYQVAGDGYNGGYGGGWGGRGGGGWGGRGGGGGWGGGGGGRGGGGGGWGGGGGGCRWGCCGRNGWGGCRCCYNAEEAKAYMASEAKP